MRNDMASVNKVILVGNLGKDPELRTFPNGDQIANATLATTDRWKNKQTGEPVEHTEWHRLVFNGRLAEIAGQYLRKGSSIYVEGSIRTRKWQDKSGQDSYSTEIRVDQMQMLGGRRDSDSAPPAARPASRPPTASARAPAAAPAASTSSSGFDGMDDDIPF